MKIRVPGEQKRHFPTKNVLRLLAPGGLRACDGFTQSELKELKFPDSAAFFFFLRELR